MEAEILDSVSGERIAAIMDGGEELEKMKLNLSQVTQGMTWWGDVKRVFAFWGERLRTWLDKAHGIEKKDD
jgi:hypothetical protein